MSQISSQDITSKVADIYRDLLGPKLYDEILTEEGEIGQRFRLLQAHKSRSTGFLSSKSNEARQVINLIFSSIVIEAASGSSRGVFDLPELRNPNQIAPARSRRGTFRGTANQEDEWLFSQMVRGWLYLKDFGHLTDLDFDRRFRDNKKCDYAIQHSDEYIELIECKRLRPDRTTNEDQSMSAAKKIIRKLGSVVEQFEGAAKVLGDSVQNNLLMVDISEYNKTGQQYGSGKKSIRLIGFQDNEIEQIVSILLTSSNEHSRVPDRITICWNVIVEIDGVFAAIVQRSRTLCFDKRILMKFEYSGWTAEAYSIASSGSGNIRVASQAFSVDRIITTFNMARDPGAFAKAGKPVTP